MGRRKKQDAAKPAPKRPKDPNALPVRTTSAQIERNKPSPAGKTLATVRKCDEVLITNKDNVVAIKTNPSRGVMNERVIRSKAKNLRIEIYEE